MTLLGVLFVTFSGVVGDLHLGYQKGHLEEAGSWILSTHFFLLSFKKN